MYKRQILLVLLVVLMVSTALANLSVCSALAQNGRVEQNAQAQQKSYQIASLQSLPLRNQTTGKTLMLRVTYPLGSADPCPVIVFSHGAGGSKDAYQYVIDYWASHGYVCIQPNHQDSINPAADRSAMTFSLMKIVKTLPSDYKLWASRFADVSSIIDALPVIQEKIPARIDVHDIACAGHSLGAFTTAVIGGATVPRASKTTSSPQDPRVKALIMLSPQAVRHADEDFGFDDDKSWVNLRLPSLFMTGTRDGTKWTPAQNRRMAFDGSPPGNKFFVMIDGASHMTFAGVNRQPPSQQSAFGSGSGFGHGMLREAMARRMKDRVKQSMPSETGDHMAMLQDIQAITTDFLDAYLKNDRGKQAELCQPAFFGPLVSIECK